MRVLLGVLILTLAAAGITYASASLFLHFSGALIDTSDRTKLTAIMPQLLAAVGTVTAALVGGGVALINWLAQRDLAAVQRKYIHELEGKKIELSGQLEEKKNALSARLEREKAQLDVLKSEVSRKLALFQRATDIVSKYANEIRALRRGIFKPDDIEKFETDVRSLLVEFDRETEPHDSIRKFFQGGIFVRERAERRSTPQGYKELWVEEVEGKQICTTFAQLEDAALTAIRRSREACLADNALTVT